MSKWSSKWEYKIISDSNLNGLEKLINEAADEDFEPINIFCDQQHPRFHCLLRRPQ